MNTVEYLLETDTIGDYIDVLAELIELIIGDMQQIMIMGVEKI